MECLQNSYRVTDSPALYHQEVSDNALVPQLITGQRKQSGEVRGETREDRYQSMPGNPPGERLAGFL